MLRADYLQLCQNGAEAKFMTKLCLVVVSFSKIISVYFFFFFLISTKCGLKTGFHAEFQRLLGFQPSFPTRIVKLDTGIFFLRKTVIFHKSMVCYAFAIFFSWQCYCLHQDLRLLKLTAWPV